MKGDSAGKVKIRSIDELWSSQNVPEREQIQPGEQAVMLNIAEVHDYKGHTFRVQDDELMAETYESIKLYGVLEPGIARVDPRGGYECIAGHRRKRGCFLAGREEMPFIIREVSDAMADVIMIDTNIQRGGNDCLPSEKAFSYKKRLEATRVLQRSEPKPEYAGVRADEIMAREIKEARSTIQRYIRLTELIPELLKLVDVGKVPVTTAAELSYLNRQEQQLLYVYITEHKTVPSGAQAEILKRSSKERHVDQEALERILGAEKAKPTRIVLKEQTLSSFFPPGYGQRDMEAVILKLLEKWKTDYDRSAEKEKPMEGQLDVGTWENGKYLPDV